MKIGIITDSHDRIETTNKAMQLIKEKGAKVLIHCGDFCAPFMMNELSKFKGEVHCVFGNIDDRFVTPNRAKDLGINCHGDTAELEFEGKKILKIGSGDRPHFKNSRKMDKIFGDDVEKGIDFEKNTFDLVIMEEVLASAQPSETVIEPPPPELEKTLPNRYIESE